MRKRHALRRVRIILGWYLKKVIKNLKIRQNSLKIKKILKKPKNFSKRYLQNGFYVVNYGKIIIKYYNEAYCCEKHDFVFGDN